MTTAPIVIDLYHGDGVQSFDKARQAGLVGVIHKASTGASGVDDAYAARRKKAKDANLLWGAYHWGTHAPVKSQVDNFLSRSDPDEATLVALDFEATKDNQMTLNQAREFLEILGEKLGRKPVLYAGGLLKDFLGSKVDEFFGAHRLWLAQYSFHPKVQASWKTYWLWQYTDGEFGPQPHSCPGIDGDSKGRLDCNHFDGTAELLAKEWAS